MKSNYQDDGFFNTEPVSDDFFTTGLETLQTEPEYFEQGVETDPDEFFKLRQKNILSDVSAAYGGDLEFGRTTKQLGRGILNLLDITPTTDVDRLHTDLLDLQQNESELAKSPQGQAYQRDIHQRIRSVLDADELDISDTIKLLVNKTVDNPTEMLDMIGEGMIEDPLLPLLFAGAYHTGGRSAQAAAKLGGLSNLIAKLKTGSTAARAAAISLQGATEITGVMGGEAGLGFLYEVAQNKALGQDPMHNAKQMAAMGALLGGGIKGLSTAFKLVRGYPGKYISPQEAFNDLIESGFVDEHSLPEIIRLLQENFQDLPKDSMEKLAAAARANKIYDIPFNENKPKRSQVVDNLDDLLTTIRKDYIEEDLPGLGARNIYSNKRMTYPVGTTVKQGIYYNLNEVIKDFQRSFPFLRGETAKGTRGTSRAAQVRADAFKDFNFKEFEKWINRNGGAKAYAEFLMRLEANKLRYTRQKTPNSQVYKRAAYNTLLEMGADPRQFSKRLDQRIPYKLEAGWNYAKRSALEVAQNPALLYQPVKDVLMGTKQFAEDIIKGPAENMGAYRDARRQISNMLRDWEGGRMAGELEINDFANYIKGQLKTQDKLEAISHYMEGNLEGYNQYRVNLGLKPVELTAEELKTAPVIRKFFNDMVDWTQRAELFQDFRQNKQLYNVARNYSAGSNSVDYIKGQKGQALEDAMWAYIKSLENPFAVARRITPKHKRDKYEGFELPRRENYVPHVVRTQFAPDDNSIIQSTLMDAHRAQQLQTKSPFTRHRVHDTLVDALNSGETLLTQDISQLIRMYGKSMLRSQLNRRLVDQLRKTRSTATGKPMLGAKDQVPDYYVEFKHPNFTDRKGDPLYVNPNMAPDLRLYFDTNDPTIANRMVQNIVLISKRASLGLSLFHMMALAWSGLATGQPVNQVIRNLLPMSKRFQSQGLRALAGEEGYMELLRGMRNGLGIGVLEELKGDTLINAMRRIGGNTEKLLAGNRYLKPIGKAGNMAFRGTARAQEIIDTHLWDHVNTGLKATTYLTTFEKLVLRDAQKAAKTGAPLTPKDVLAQRAAQFTNDAYGNQNWNQMAMNVEGRIGHRVAAALNKPSMRGYIRMLVFAPDWTLSNIRVIGKALDVTDKAHPAYLAYAIRSALLFAMVGEALQQTSGQGSIFDDDIKDALRPDLGNGKQMEISKQLAEVIRMMPWVHGPGHVLSHKMGTLPKAYLASDSVGEFFGEVAYSSIPISMQQYLKSGDESAFYGALGIPVYDK